jgi:hypothetical protein
MRHLIEASMRALLTLVPHIIRSRFVCLEYQSYPALNWFQVESETRGLGNRSQDPPPAYSDSLRPIPAKV